MGDLRGAAKDRVVRAMTGDGQFRVIALVMRDSCMEAFRRQSVDGEILVRQAQLMCAAVLVRETMQPANRVQITLKDVEGNRLVADALPDGQNRSIVNPGEGNSKLRPGTGLLQVNYTLRTGDLHTGIVPLDEGADVSSAIMHYFMQSEQIVAFVCIDAIHLGTDAPVVGGFVVQMTPETTADGLREMTELLAERSGLHEWLSGLNPDPAALVGELLVSRDYSVLATSPLSFGCTCSLERMLLGLSTLSSAEVCELIAEGDIEVSCDACGRNYVVPARRLAQTLAENGNQGPLN